MGSAWMTTPLLNTRKLSLALLGSLALMLSACADYTNQKALNSAEVEVDPAEPLNRIMYDIHTGLDTVIFRPVASAYRFVMPEFGRDAVSNFVRNLASPVVFVNSVLQGDQENTFATFWRFVINTAFGLGGLIDVASDGGLKNRSADFGQTLYVWGVDSGPYTFLPVFGPGTVRDSFGRVVDIFFNPTVWFDEPWLSYAQAGITIVDARSSNYTTINDIYDNSLDPYATFRSGYLQKRTNELNKLRPSAPRAPRASASVRN